LKFFLDSTDFYISFHRFRAVHAKCKPITYACLSASFSELAFCSAIFVLAIFFISIEGFQKEANNQQHTDQQIVQTYAAKPPRFP